MTPVTTHLFTTGSTIWEQLIGFHVYNIGLPHNITDPLPLPRVLSVYYGTYRWKVIFAKHLPCTYQNFSLVTTTCCDAWNPSWHKPKNKPQGFFFNNKPCQQLFWFQFSTSQRSIVICCFSTGWHNQIHWWHKGVAIVNLHLCHARIIPCVAAAF